MSLTPQGAAARHVDRRPPFVILTGPTGSGKSAIASKAAAVLGAEVVCADSRQLYRGLPVTSAQPTREELGRAPHHLYECLEPGTACSAGGYRELAVPVLAECAARGRTALVTGGSGFYLKALTGGVSLAPPGRPETVAALRARLTTEGPGALRRELEERDPASAAAIMPADTYRLLRALAVLADTGKPRSVFVAAPVAATPAVFLALAVPRPMLYARIEARCAGMIRTGALDEARALRARGLPADDPLWRAIGMPHLCGVLDGTLTVGEAQSRMAQDTRHYAKRQMTWLRGQPGVRWIDAVDERAAVAAVIEAARTAEK